MRSPTSTHRRVRYLQILYRSGALCFGVWDSMEGGFVGAWRRAEAPRCCRMLGQERERAIISPSFVEEGTRCFVGVFSTVWAFSSRTCQLDGSERSDRSVEHTERALAFLDPHEEADSGRSRRKGEMNRGFSGCGRGAGWTSLNPPACHLSTTLGSGIRPGSAGGMDLFLRPGFKLGSCCPLAAAPAAPSLETSPGPPRPIGTPPCTPEN